MLKRTITVVVCLPILIFLVYLGGLPLVLLCTIASLMGLYELYTALLGKYKHIHLVGYIFTVGYFAAIYFAGTGYTQLVALILFIIAALTCMVVFFKKLTLQECVGVVFGVLYVPFLISFVVMLRGQSQFYVWLIFLSAFGCDTFAYLVGVNFGKHKLKNSPSPIKSVEGIFGGIVGAALLGCIYGFFVVQFSGQFSGMEFILHSVVICVVTSAFCVVGDMAASAIKRYSGIKDFGNVFPGHGGVLDRIDSIVVAAPVVYLLVRLVSL